LKNFSEYMRDQEARAREAENIAGITFEDCLRDPEAKGKKSRAALLFGRAYWEAREPGRYPRFYDNKLAGIEVPIQRITDREAEKHIRADRWPHWYAQKYFPHILAKVRGIPVKTAQAPTPPPLAPLPDDDPNMDASGFPLKPEVFDEPTGEELPF
jgi:hypothetical protein